MSVRGTFRTAPSDPERSAMVRAQFRPLRELLFRSYWVLGAVLSGAVQRYLGRVAERLIRLLDAIEAGRLKPLAPRVPRERTEAAEAAREEQAEVPARRARDVRLPRERFWLGKAYAGKIGIGGGIGVVSGCIEAFLNRPEVMALLAREPVRARRILGPLAHWTGMIVPVLRDFPAPRRKRAPRARAAGPSVAERKAELWYPNVQGKPIDLWRESRLIERAAKKARLGE